MTVLRSMGWRHYAAWLAVVAVLLLPFATLTNQFHYRILVSGLIFAIVVIGLDLLIGYAGYLSFAQAAFFGLGAYTVASLTSLRASLSWWLAMVVALLVSALISYLLAVPLFRLKRIHFAIGSLAAGELMWLTYRSWTWFSGGNFGIERIPRPAIGGFGFTTNQRYYGLVVAVTLLVAMLTWGLTRSRTGRALRAVRQDEVLAESRGLDIVRYKRMAFVYAALTATAAGGLFSSLQGAIELASFTTALSLNFVMFVVLGGAGTLIGPAVGAVSVVTLQQLFQVFAAWNQLVLGLFLIIVVLLFPRGLWGVVQSLARLTTGRRPPPRRAPIGAATATADAVTDGEPAVSSTSRGES